MTIDFRKKVALIMACYVLLTSLHLPMFKAYADSENLPTNEVFYSLQKEFKYDSNTDTYYFPINDIDKLENQNSKSATVAVSGAVISSVLTLAVKAGLEFATTNSMSEFVSRFFMLDGISSVVDGLNGAIKTSVGGVINFSQSLLDTVGSKFAELMSKKVVDSIYIMGRKFPLYDSSNSPSTSVARYLFESSTLPKLAVDMTTITSSDNSNGQRIDIFDTNIEIPSSKVIGTFSVEFYKKRFSSPYQDRVLAKVKNPSTGAYVGGSGSYAVTFSTDTFSKAGSIAYVIPYIHDHYSGEYSLGIVVAIYSTVTGYLDQIKAVETETRIPHVHAGASSPLPVIGESWSSGSISTGDKGSIQVSIPKDTNTLVNKKPTDIDAPTYIIWTPGTTVVPPAIDTGTNDTPKDDVLPPITEDTPGEDTDNPGDSTPGDDTTNDNPTSWNWLKELLNRLLELIQTIIDWLTNFWDRLLEFIKSLFVPGDNIFKLLFSDC